MIYKGTSVSLWLMLGFGALLGLALVYWIAVEMLYALPFLGALLWYLWWLDHGTSGAARLLGGRPPGKSRAGRHRDRERREFR
jgi:hypothetical protein